MPDRCPTPDDPGEIAQEVFGEHHYSDGQSLPGGRIRSLCCDGPQSAPLLSTDPGP